MKCTIHFLFYQSLLRESKSTSIPSQGFRKSISFKSFHVHDAKPLYFRTDTKFFLMFMIQNKPSFYLNPAFKMIYENIILIQRC